MKQRGWMRSGIARAAMLAVLTAVVLAGCATSGPNTAQAPFSAVVAGAPAYPNVTFMVLSDTHFYDPSLGTSGKAWEAYMADDRKLLADSEETLQAAMEKVRLVKPSFLLVTGDLTKDGEKQCHDKFAGYLEDLKNAGIPSYVIPGNHDINNPHANRFLPTGETRRVPSVNPAEFADIYADFGYGHALYRDPASLSYIVQPVPGLWLLALDSAKYENNAAMNYPQTSGAIRAATYTWIEQHLREAAQQGVAVIACEHHPIMEHFDGMQAKFPEYIVDDNWRIANLLAAYNVRIIFTGHYHANSIVMHRWDQNAPAILQGKYIVDAETGSLVTWPCSFRTVTLSDSGSATITTSRVGQLPSYAAAGKSFDTDGKRVIEDGIANIAVATMKKYFVPQHDIDIIIPEVLSAMMAHYAGDAHFQGDEMLTHKGLSVMGGLVVSTYNSFVEGLWRVRPPVNVQLMEDNNLLIKADGTWSKTEAD